ncbi:efflux transporter periplasmic adaptor subunit [Pedobacter psychrophilus]|uniref:Efflux transporter periplasmic adaptor subunit n=1 Tax=Pedobacter psychrophilus TaxID=1826909 RepID=A0A179DIG0_9SPHI|nr:efflux RND transporter periplasmic adaptor subunit [Pedobacter psychrophilus]OAQ40674.1 efflux transporter periplasmic adaptor subunit [Pedobacter psychrophilus]
MKLKHIIYIIIALLLCYLVYNRITKSSSSKGAEGKGVKSGADQAISVKGMIVKTQTFTNDIAVSGSIDANEQVQIRSEVSGLVRKINFSEGSNVSKGSLLIKIDDSELQAQLVQALTKEKLASETENRAQKLLKAEAISQEEYDATLAEFKSLKAQSQLIRAQLARTEIRAPFSGKIGLRNISDGAYITPTTEITNLVSINPIKITFSVPEKYAQRVQVGAAITFTVAGNSKKYTAKVYAKEPGISVDTRSLVIRAKADNNGDLLPGTFANINLPLEEIKDAILIPSEAVIPILKGKQIYLSKDGKAKTIVVNSDIRTDQDILVTDGLSVGDTVIISGIMALKEGAKVKVNILKSKN